MDLSLCILSPYQIFPPRTGGTVRIFNLVKNLCKLGCFVNLILPNGFNKDIQDVSHFKNLRIISHQLLNNCFKDFFDGYAPVRYIPLRFSFIISKILKHLTELKEYDFDTIQSEELWPGLHALALKTLRRKVAILDSPNVETLRIFREYKNGHKAWELVRGINLVEKFLCRHFDQILTTSNFDKNVFCNIHSISPSKITIIENGVDIRQFRPNKRTGETIRRKIDVDDSTPVVIFIGNYDYPPNLDAAYTIVNKIYPEVVKKINDVVFMFTGSNTPSWLRKEESENVILTGWVKDISSYINAANVCIAPIRFGSGTRIKILEYMACGKPVVSTKLGVEGLEATNGEHLLLEDNPNKFATYIVNLIENKDLAKKLGEQGRILVQEKYGWETIVKKLILLYDKMLS